MSITQDKRAVQRISLLDSLSDEWVKLPHFAMQSCGAAAQTLGGILKVTQKETFVPISTIARNARVPARTCKNHLNTLGVAGFISRKGREHTRGGHLRRTATITISQQTRDAIEPWGFLPWWACCSINKAGKLDWSTRAVLSVVMAQLCTLKSVCEREGVDDDVEGAMEKLGGDERFRFSLARLERDTGLTRDSIIGAKVRLKKLGIVKWYRDQRDDGGCATDMLVPNHAFRVVVTPAGEERCYLSFDVEK